MTRPSQRPEGALIEGALEQLPGLSATKAAERAGISEARWRQITKGYISHGAGQYAAVTAPAATLARMAAVVRVTPEQLEEVGRQDAADSLRKGPVLAEPPVSAGEVPGGDLPAKIDWVYRQPWSAVDKQRVIDQLIEVDQQADQERRAAG